MSKPEVSVVIPNRNGSATIGRCLRAAFASQHRNFEVIVVDDSSTDSSLRETRKFPCRVVELPEHAGAAAARNAGARLAAGRILFFTDADCLLGEDTLATAQRALTDAGTESAVGGTYARKPPEDSFFSVFQAVFVNYFETKNHNDPDYVATHAMAIFRETFLRHEGFPEDFLPILEDVEFSHRLKRSGVTLKIDPSIVVRHIFNYSLADSLRNAWRKSRYWTAYSLRNRDLLADSGTASRELKANVIVCFLTLVGAPLSYLLGSVLIAGAVLTALTCNLLVSRGLLGAFFQTGGARFGLAASAYYVSLYPLAVGTGALTGLLKGPRRWSAAGAAS